MSINFSCGCGAKFRAPEHLAGKAIRCKTCQELVRVPNSSGGATELVTARPVRPPTAAPVRQVVSPLDDLGSLDDFGGMDFGGLDADPLGPTPAANHYSSGSYRLGGAPAASAYLPPKKSSSSTFNPLLLIGITLGVLVVAGLAVGGVYSIRMLAAGGSSSNAPPSEWLDDSSESVQQSRERSAKLASSITEAEALAVAENFAQALRGRDFNLANHLFPFADLLDRSLDGVDASAKFREAFVRGANQRGLTDFFQSIHSAVNADGSYEVLRAVRRDGEVRVLVRIEIGGGLNYQELAFWRDAQQTVKVRDIYQLLQGEFMGETFRRLYLFAALSSDRSLVQRLTGQESELAKYASQIQKLPQLLQTSPQQGLNVLAQLPESLRNDKAFLTMRLVAAEKLGEQEYLAALDAFRRAYPGDAGGDLRAIDYHILRGEKQLAIDAAKRVRDYVGGDSVVEEMIQNIESLP